ncbi:MAG: TonB family protein [Thermoanaerobaculales bacterium]
MPEAYRSFASYLLLSEILADPLGHLYRAGEFDPDGIKKTVWLRVFDAPSVPSSEILASFSRARKIAAAVQSTNIAGGVDHIDCDGVPAMACDYVAGQPLTRVFDRATSENFPVPVDNALLILEKIALALAAALTIEVDGERSVHGFLHPGLIFVTNDGEGIVSGFGLADRLLALVDDAASTDSIHPYLAPEVLLTRTATRQGDVYSLGAILFRLLTGVALPSRSEEREKAFQGGHLAYEEQPIPDDIQELLRRALAQRPEDRYSSAADFKKELDKLLYGGAYSPTTFNLALFMDRLFRTEIDVEDEKRANEGEIDISPYLAPEPEPEAILESEPTTTTSHRKALMVGGGLAGTAAVVVAILFMIGGGPETPPPPPAPTAEIIAAQRQAQEEKMRAMTQGLVQQMMAEKEAEIRQELLDRQTKIDELQKRLLESERRAKKGALSNEERRKQRDLQQQIAAEEKVKRQREADLEAETRRAEEKARQQAAEQQAATATAAAAEEARLADEAAAATPSPPPPIPTRPTAVPTAASEPASETQAVAVKENSFVAPEDVDSLPVVLKKYAVAWPRLALHSRRDGVIIARVLVNANGRAEEIKVLRADHEGFGIPQAVVDAIRQYRFKPAIKNGVRVKSYATVTERYRFVGR